MLLGLEDILDTCNFTKILNKKIIIHEQNSIMGRTNRILSKVADKITINYKNTIFADKTAIVTGIPIRIGKNLLKKIERKKQF